MKVHWQSHFVPWVSWQDLGITCTRFLHYLNLCLWLATAQGKGVLLSRTAPELQETLLEHEGFGVSQGQAAQFRDIYL